MRPDRRLLRRRVFVRLGAAITPAVFRPTWGGSSLVDYLTLRRPGGCAIEGADEKS